jgi:alpha-galactosidase
MGRKMVLIGAGSAVFTQGLVMDMIAQEWDEPWELCLVDIDKPTLDNMGVLCAKMVKEKKKDDTIKIKWSTEREEVLAGADFVVSTIGVGGRRAWEKDVFIPREYGVFQPVGDSVAPGGISRAQRMIPALAAIAEDIKKLCPKAFFFSYSNPMTTNCTAVRKETGVPVIGLCHGVKNGLRRLARFAGLPEDGLTGHVVGLNHFVIAYRLYCDGRDAWPKIHAAVERPAPGAEVGPLSAGFIKLYNAYPVSDDRHYSEFTQQYFGRNAYFGKTLGVDAYSFENTISHGDKNFTRTAELAQSKENLPAEFWRRLEGEHEQLMVIIQSILHDRCQVFNVNMPNNGSVASLPHNAVLEMPAVASAHGFVPLRIEDFPPVFTGMLSKHIGIADLTVRAALEGSRSLFEEAIWQGGYMESRSKTAEMADKLLMAQKEYNTRYK